MMTIASAEGALTKFKLLTILKVFDNALSFFVLAFAGDDILLCHQRRDLGMIFSMFPLTRVCLNSCLEGSKKINNS